MDSQPPDANDMRRLASEVRGWREETRRRHDDHERRIGTLEDAFRVLSSGITAQLSAINAMLADIRTDIRDRERVDIETLRQLSSVRVEAREAKLSAAQTAGVGAGGGAVVALVAEVVRSLLGW